MSNVKVFNELLMEFVQQLATTYPSVPGIAAAPEKLQILIDSNQNMAYNQFMEAVSPYVTQICNREDSFFQADYKNIAFLADINFEQHWERSPPETKSAIWEYMYNLILLGGSLQNIPPDLMQDITQFVNGYEKMTEGQELDVNHLIANLQKDKNLSQLFSNQ